MSKKPKKKRHEYRVYVIQQIMTRHDVMAVSRRQAALKGIKEAEGYSESFDTEEEPRVTVFQLKRTDRGLPGTVGDGVHYDVIDAELKLRGQDRKEDPSEILENLFSTDLERASEGRGATELP